MKNKKLGIALLTFAVFTNIQAKSEKHSREGFYQPASTDAVIIIPGIEDAVVGAGATVAEIVTFGHANTGNAPTGLLVAVPDVFGASKARADKDSDSKKRVKKEKTKKSSSTRTKKPQSEDTE